MVHFERVMERTRSDAIVTCGYMARVRIRVRAGSTEIIREGTGWGSATSDATAADNGGQPDVPSEAAGMNIGPGETSPEVAVTSDGDKQLGGVSDDTRKTSGSANVAREDCSVAVRQSSAGEAEANSVGNGRGAVEARIEGDAGAFPGSLSGGDAGDVGGADAKRDDGLPSRRSGSPAVRITLGSGDAFRRYTGQSSRRRTPHRFPSRSEIPSSKPAVAGSIALTSVVATPEEKASSSGSAQAFLPATAQIEAKSNSPKNVMSVEGNPASTLSEVMDARSAPDPSPSMPSKIAFGLKIDKSKLWLGLERRLRDKAHLRRVAELPCLVCNRQPSHAHHLRFAQRRGLSQKVSDEYVVPLCALHHGDLHRSSSEQKWWARQQIDPVTISLVLWTKHHKV
jgi:hypothetical protein